ncbi:hypothetical protein KSS87_014807 [Heliosperma pusillum]|nr:hypothetical protein KSS87_014807 [Heliosperma pusillum]
MQRCCSPNLKAHMVLVESMDFQLEHIGLYAKQDVKEGAINEQSDLNLRPVIEAGEELSYDYGYNLQPEEGHPCFCESANCRGRVR